VISQITFILRPYIIRAISFALRTQGTQALRGKQLFRHDIHHGTFLHPRQWGIRQCHSENHIRPYAPIYRRTIHGIEQIIIPVHKGFRERFIHRFDNRINTLDRYSPHQFRIETKSIIPKSVKFHYITGTSYDRFSVYGRIHPSNRLIFSISEK